MLLLAIACVLVAGLIVGASWFLIDLAFKKA